MTDPTVRDVWETLPDDIRKDVYTATNALIKRKQYNKELYNACANLNGAIVFKRINEDQSNVIYYLIGAAVANKQHPIDAGKDLLIVWGDKEENV